MPSSQCYDYFLLYSCAGLMYAVTDMVVIFHSHCVYMMLAPWSHLPSISVSQSFSTSFSIWVPEPLGGVFDGDIPFNTYTVNFLTFCTLYHCKLLSKLRSTERSFSDEGALIYGYSDISLGGIILLCSFSKTIGVMFPLVCKLSGLFILRVNKYTFSKDFHY